MLSTAPLKARTLGSEVLEVQAAAGELAGKVSVLLDEVNRASKEQMKGINQITGAITQTNSVVQQTAAGAEERPRPARSCWPRPKASTEWWIG